MCLSSKKAYTKKTKVKKAYKVFLLDEVNLYSGFYPATLGPNINWIYPINIWVDFKPHNDTCHGFYSLRKLSDAIRIISEPWNFSTEYHRSFIHKPKLVIYEVNIKDIEFEGILRNFATNTNSLSYISKKIKILKIVKE